MQIPRMTRFVFAITLNARGKTLSQWHGEASEIISLVCFEAQLSGESHVPVPQRQAGREGQGVDGQEPQIQGC